MKCKGKRLKMEKMSWFKCICWRLKMWFIAKRVKHKLDRAYKKTIKSYKFVFDDHKRKDGE